MIIFQYFKFIFNFVIYFLTWFSTIINSPTSFTNSISYTKMQQIILNLQHTKNITNLQSQYKLFNKNLHRTIITNTQTAYPPQPTYTKITTSTMILNNIYTTQSLQTLNITLQLLLKISEKTVIIWPNLQNYPQTH